MNPSHPTVSVVMSVYDDVSLLAGGMDEGFEGWGGEDAEFWDRCQTLSVWNSGYLPLVHFWHAPQPGKTPAKGTPAMRRLQVVLRTPATDRIRTLRRTRTDDSH